MSRLRQMLGPVTRLARSRRGAVWLIALATVVGIGLRLGFGLAYWVDKPLTHDELEYLTLAQSLATGDGFRYPPPAPDEVPVERFGRAPLYPAFLAVVGRVTGVDTTLGPSVGSAPAAIKAVQAVVSALIIPLLALFAWRAAGPSAGVSAAAVAAVYPPLAWLSAYVLSEAVFVVLAWSAAFCLALTIDPRPPGSPSSGRVALALLAGALGGLAALARPVMVVYLVLAALWLAARGPRRLAVALLLAATVVIGPWTARNYVEYGRFVLIASEGGITFWTGNHPLAIGEGDMAANPQIKQANLAFRREHPGLSPEALEPLYYRDAWDSIRAAPFRWLTLVARKAFYLIVPIGPSYTLHSRLYQAGVIVPYLLLLPAAVAGAFVLLRRKIPVTALWLMPVSAVATGLVFFPQERFRLPIVDPALIVCAAVWVAGRRTEPRQEGASRESKRAHPR